MKSRPDVGVVLEIRGEDLEGDVASHRVVVRAIDDAHRAAADSLDHLIASDAFRMSASRAIVNGHRHSHCAEQRATSAVMLSRLPCSRAVLIKVCASTGRS